MTEIWLAGVDACRGGWMTVFVQPDGTDARLRIVPHFTDIFASAETPVVVAVDIPIGLPERSGRGGRAAENAIRPLLGKRQSSVFSVPSRSAIYAADYAEACRIALATCDPPRKVSKQLHCIAPKIREVDAALRSNPSLVETVYETHPELAFWQLNGRSALDEPKKVKGRPYSLGLALRRRLLTDAGMPWSSLEAAPPRGAASDDLLDAIAGAAVARRIHGHVAQPFPDPRPRDSCGLPMAIWA
jgi:predicted RNase H-like nuclease